MSEENKSYTLKIVADHDAENPRKWIESPGTMAAFHTKYNLGDEVDFSHDDFDGWDDMEKYLINEEKATIIIPISLYDHSGIGMSCGVSRGWDSGQVGFIYVNRVTALEFLGLDPERTRLTKKRRRRVESALRSEVETYSQYLEGEVYGYVIEDEDGEAVDSLWGIYGYDYAEECGQTELAALQAA